MPENLQWLSQCSQSWAEKYFVLQQALEEIEKAPFDDVRWYKDRASIALKTAQKIK